MTVLCGGGTSSARPEFGEVVYVLPQALGAFLNKIPTLWAVGAAGYIGKITFNLATFCQTDPPAVPTFTAQDVVDIFNPYNPFTYTNAQQKFQDLVGAFMWHDLCKCDNGTVPTLPTPPAEPTGAPDVNPPQVGPTYPTGQACSVDTHEFVQAASNTSVYFSPLVPIPTGATSIRVDALTSVPATTNGTLNATVRFGTSGYTGYPSSAFLGNVLPYAGIDTTGHITNGEVAVPTGAVSWWWAIGGSNIVPTPITLDATASWYCGTSAGDGGVVPQPCPTDPFVQATLDQILALVTLIQRQNAPFAYVTSTTHTGLTGSGSITVQGLLGAKVEVTNHGFNTGVQLGDPDELWDAGWVNWGNADGVSPRQFITNDVTLSLPALAGQYTEIHYSLEPGVQVDITELVREP